MLEAYRQGQRDREQGWPAMAYLWDFTGALAVAYYAGYSKPRV